MQGWPVSFRPLWAGCCTAWATGCNRRANGRKARTHPDRNAQFEHINQTADQHLTAGHLVVSVDTKKKELVGNFKNGGREWQPKGTPPAVLVHDFPTDAEGKAMPYGVYDLARNEAWVSVGWDHDDTAVRSGVDSILVASDGLRRIARGHDPVRSRPMRSGAPRIGCAPGSMSFIQLADEIVTDHRGESFSTRHQQVEQDRATALLPHHGELARHPCSATYEDHR